MVTYSKAHSLPTLQALTTIVRRDFFPDVPKLEAQLEFIEATETNDYERLRAISERFPTSLNTPQPAGKYEKHFPTGWVLGVYGSPSPSTHKKL